MSTLGNRFHKTACEGTGNPLTHLIMFPHKAPLTRSAAGATLRLVYEKSITNFCKSSLFET